MERIVYRKTLDVHKNGIQFTLQGFETADNLARRIEISLMASGDTVDLPLEQMVAMLYIKTPKASEPSINECTIKDNIIIYDVLPIVEEGITEMQLKLIDARPDGANKVLVSPKFAIEVAKSGTNDEDATQSTTFTALEEAVATAKGVYDSRLVSIELSPDCTFRAYYADGTYYESEVLKEVVLNGESLIAKSYARGGTGIRAGEDTDNSMYYSNVSKSASANVDRVSGEATEILQEVRKHGVYTAFSVNFETGEVEYISPSYTFDVNEETGELEAYGIAYNPDERCEVIVNELLAEYSETHDGQIETLNGDVITLKQDVDDLYGNADYLASEVAKANDKIAENIDYIVEQGYVENELGQKKLRYAKYKSGREEVWYTTPNLTLPAKSHNQFTYEIPEGIFTTKPTFFQTTFITDSSASGMGLCQVSYSMANQSTSQLVINVYNNDDVKRTPNVCIYATHW